MGDQKWVCYLFGADPVKDDGIKYTPGNGYYPSFFKRVMMKIFFDCTWVKE